MFVLGKPFQPCLFFEGKARSLQLDGASERYFTRVGYSLTRKHYTRQERPISCKHSSLLLTLIKLGLKMLYNNEPSGLYYKKIMIVNDTSRVIRIMPQLRASLTIVILMTLEVSLMLLESSIMLLNNIYSTGITYNDRHLQWSYFSNTGHRLLRSKNCVRTNLSDQWLL